MAGLLRGGGGGERVAAAHNSKIIGGNETKFGGIVENHRVKNEKKASFFNINDSILKK